MKLKPTRRHKMLCVYNEHDYQSDRKEMDVIRFQTNDLE